MPLRTETPDLITRLFLEEIPDAIDLAAHAESYRVEYNTLRPHENLSWNRPIDVHLGLADPTIPTFPEPENLQRCGSSSSAGDRFPRLVCRRRVLNRPRSLEDRLRELGFRGPGQLVEQPR